MVCLKELPRQENLSILKQFYNRTDPLNPHTPHVTKLVIDDCVIPINTVILSWWTETFQELRDDSDEIYVEGFMGDSEQFKDCLSILHGYNVDISFSNVQVSFLLWG